MKSLLTGLVSAVFKFVLLFFLLTPLVKFVMSWWVHHGQSSLLHFNARRLTYSIYFHTWLLSAMWVTDLFGMVCVEISPDHYLGPFLFPLSALQIPLSPSLCHFLCSCPRWTVFMHVDLVMLLSLRVLLISLLSLTGFPGGLRLFLCSLPPAAACVDALLLLGHHFWCPLAHHSRPGSQFTSALWNSLSSHGVELHHRSSYHPQNNGLWTQVSSTQQPFFSFMDWAAHLVYILPFTRTLFSSWSGLLPISFTRWNVLSTPSLFQLQHILLTTLPLLQLLSVRLWTFLIMLMFEWTLIPFPLSLLTRDLIMCLIIMLRLFRFFYLVLFVRFSLTTLSQLSSLFLTLL